MYIFYESVLGTRSSGFTKCTRIFWVSQDWDQTGTLMNLGSRSEEPEEIACKPEKYVNLKDYPETRRGCVREKIRLIT